MCVFMCACVYECVRPDESFTVFLLKASKCDTSDLSIFLRGFGDVVSGLEARQQQRHHQSHMIRMIIYRLSPNFFLLPVVSVCPSF